MIDAAATVRTDPTVRRLVIWATYVTLALVMIWSRFAAIGASLSHDEIFTIQNYVIPGPAGSFGRYGTNDHILFSLLAWLTVHLPGLGDSAYRLWSIVPFVTAAAIVTGWLHKRAGAAVAVLFAVLSIASTQLLIFASEARGYGLAFLAMAVMTVAAYEACIHKSGGWLTLFAAAGVIGCWTLPTFVLPLVGASGVLLSQRALRRGLLVRLVVVFLAVGGWYAIPAPAVIASRGQEFGARLPWHAPLTGGATEFAAACIPALSPAGFIPAIVVLPLLGFGVSRAGRELPHITALTVRPSRSRFSYSPSAASSSKSGSSAICWYRSSSSPHLASGRSRRRGRGFAGMSAAYAGLVVVSFVSAFAFFSVRHARLPEEANREAAGAVAAALARAPRPVVFNTERPRDILYYLPGPVPVLDAPPATLDRLLCSQHFERTGLIFVQQPFGVDLADTSCLVRRGAAIRVFRQWDRGLWISVWEILPKRLANPRAGT